jgi:AraC-like DNA-binding protein
LTRWAAPAGDNDGWKETIVTGRFKGKFAIGATALAVAGFAGGAYAATQSGTSSRQQFINDVANRLHVSPDQLQSALKAAMLDRINEAVKDGRLTQAQANAIEQRINQGKLPLFFGHRRVRSGLRHLELRAAEQYLGLTRAQLIAQLRSGKSLAQVAQAQGKTTTGLEAAMTAALKTRLDQAVSAGRITNVQEQTLLSRFATRLDYRVNHAGLARTHP